MKVKLAGCFSLILLSVNAYAGSCAAILQDSIDWIRAAPSVNRIEVIMSQLRAPAKFLGYSGGVFNTVSPGSLLFGPSIIATNVLSLFSDRIRYLCPQGSQYCTDPQPFDYQHADKVDLSIYSSKWLLFSAKSNSEWLKITLKSWGNVTYTVPLECSSGFLYGVLNEPTGNSMITLSLNKISIIVPK